MTGKEPGPAAMDESYEQAQVEAQESGSPVNTDEPDAAARAISSANPAGIALTTAIEEEVAREMGEEQVSAEAVKSGIINESDLDDLSDDEEEIGLDGEEESLEHESVLYDLLEALQDSADLPPDGDDIDRVTVDPAISRTVVSDLVSEGQSSFLSKYVLSDPRPLPIPELSAALGFRLPVDVVNDEKYTTKSFEMALQVAMRYVSRTRPRLPSPRTLDEIVDVIRKSEKILVISGAGISTSLGIPDFRSDNGSYAQLEHLGLADPQEVFDIRSFKEDPSIFYSVAAKISPEEGIHSGTPTHKFIKMSNDKGKLSRNYTQNIDNLEQFVGIPKDQLVQCHGSFGSAHCITCGYSEPNGEVLFPDIKKGEIPRCPECGKRLASGKRQKHSYKDNEDDDEPETEHASFGVMKPDITFFGESLPPRFDHMSLEEGDADACDLVICMGTSSRVSPVSEIVKVVGRQVPQIYISKTPAKHSNFEGCFLGGCDDTVELLAQKLGWKLEHPMVKRPADSPDNEYPGGKIEYNDGVFKFVSDEEAQRRKEEHERAKAEVAREMANTHTDKGEPTNQENEDSEPKKETA